MTRPCADRSCLVAVRSDPVCCGGYAKGEEDGNVDNYELYLSGHKLEKDKPWLWYIYHNPSLHTGILKCEAPFVFDPIVG